MLRDSSPPSNGDATATLSVIKPVHRGLNLTGAFLEIVDRHLGILPDLDEVPVGITHVTAPFPAVRILQRLRKEGCALTTFTESNRGIGILVAVQRLAVIFLQASDQVLNTWTECNWK